MMTCALMPVSAYQGPVPAFYTADSLVHSGFTGSIKRPKYDKDETATAPSRALIPAQVQEAIADMPPCLREHGWMPEPIEVRQFKRSLTSIPDTVCQFMSAAPQQHYDLFCHGTGRNPKNPSSGLVAWGVHTPTACMGRGSRVLANSHES